LLQKVEDLMLEMVSSLGDEYIVKLFEKVPKGKRLRAKLVLKIAKDNVEAYNLAAIIELIHAASLLHDDVIDDAMQRRGKESINAVFGNKSAIMLGDILYSKAFTQLTFLPQNVAFSVSNAVALLSVGELMDVELSKQFNTDKELYFDMIYKKTASLIEATASAAAMLAGRDYKKYELYGRNLGLAFQIIDDVLDITQTSEHLGKPSMHDFKEGKTTLPYLYMYERMSANDKEILVKLFKKDLSNDDKIWIRLKMKETKALEDSVNYAKKLGKEALEAISEEDDDELEKIIRDMIERDF